MTESKDICFILGIKSKQCSNMAVLVKTFVNRFLTGPPDLTDERSMGKLPRVFVSTETDNEEFYLLVYRAMSATICLLVNGVKLFV